jgi:hypothetical protein
LELSGLQVKPLDQNRAYGTLRSNVISRIDRRQAEQLSGTTPNLENRHVKNGLFKGSVLLWQENRVSEETRPHGADPRQEVAS